jgi:hypothetical protein
VGVGVTEIPAAVAEEVARLRAENALLMRMLNLSPRQAAPPGPAQAGKWDAWYRQAIPLAEQRYEDYLKQKGHPISRTEFHHYHRDEFLAEFYPDPADKEAIASGMEQLRGAVRARVGHFAGTRPSSPPGRAAGDAERGRRGREVPAGD